MSWMRKAKIYLELRKLFPGLPFGKAPLYVWYKWYYPHTVEHPFYHDKLTIVSFEMAFRYFDMIREFESLRNRKREENRWKRQLNRTFAH